MTRLGRLFRTIGLALRAPPTVETDGIELPASLG